MKKIYMTDEAKRAAHAAAQAKYREKQAKLRTKESRQNEIAHNTTIGHPLQQLAVESPFVGGPLGLKIAYVPDTQVKDGVPTDHLVAAGMYIAEKKPDVIVVGGDWWDFESLSRHDAAGSMKKEGKRYKKDVDAGRRAMDRFMTPIAQAIGYNPTKVFTEGNHEWRQQRFVEEHPVLEGTISKDDLHLADYGWQIVPFLQPIIIGGVAFCHFFPNGVMGRPITKADDLLKKMHMSCVAGHQQGRRIAFDKRGDGQEMTAIISGSFYEHDEDYLGPFNNKHWRGMWFLHEVKNGGFDEMALSLGYLKRRYGL